MDDASRSDLDIRMAELERRLSAVEAALNGSGLVGNQPADLNYHGIRVPTLGPRDEGYHQGGLATLPSAPLGHVLGLHTMAVRVGPEEAARLMESRGNTVTCATLHEPTGDRRAWVVHSPFAHSPNVLSDDAIVRWADGSLDSVHTTSVHAAGGPAAPYAIRGPNAAVIK